MRKKMTVLVLALMCFTVGCGITFNESPQRSTESGKRLDAWNGETSTENTSDTGGIDSEEMDPASVVREEKGADYTLTESKKQLIHDIITIIPDGRYMNDMELARCVLVNKYYDDGVRNNMGKSRSLVELTVRQGEGPSPFEVEFGDIKVGDRATYRWCDLDTLTKLMEDIFGRSIELKGTQGTSIVRDNRFEDWDPAWYMDFEGYVCDYVSSDFEEDENGLKVVTHVKMEYADDDEPDDILVRSEWVRNSDSFIGYSVRDIKWDSEDTYTESNASGEFRTADDVEEYRLFVKDIVDSNRANLVVLNKEYTEFNWKKQYYYYDNQLIFAYWSEATDGSEDKRFYFKNGSMVRYVIGTQPNQLMYQIIDRSLPAEWFELEDTVLNDAGIYMP